MIASTVGVFIYMKHIIKNYLKKRNSQRDGSNTAEDTTQVNDTSKYGYWKADTKTIHTATENLYDLVLEKCNMNNKKTVLDVSCGNGDQDFYLLDKMDADKNSITGIDHSEKNIQRATKIRKLKDIPKASISFILGDPEHLSTIIRKKKYDRIISLESAYKYKTRNNFFNDTSKTLKDDGLFIITDVVMQNIRSMPLTKKLLTHIASEYLNIPSENQIDQEEWKKNITDNGLEIVEFQDLTNDTFRQYCKHTIMPSMLNNILQPVVDVVSKPIFSQFQPFVYVMAVCKKKTKHDL
jgi:cyclopropane fatty-acyl-phospholipid synthase-like methyltransferase